MSTRRVARLWSVALMLGVFPAIVPAADTPTAEPVRAVRGRITLPTYPWTAVRHPYFRGTDRVNIYPYPMLDFLERDKADRVYRTVVIENEYLRVTFLPELGGKVHEVIDKTTGQPMFYVNHVIKPALIGQAGAWTSGGIEWNTGPQGHTVGCMQPVAVEILPPEKDGSRSIVIGETERVYRTKWTVVLTLRPGRSFLEERIRIYNPTETIRPYYFWNCTAVPNTKGFRFIYPMSLGTDHGAEKFFNWPVHEGKDLTRGTNYQDASSIFAWHCDQDFFGSYNDDLGRGVVAYANHQQLPGKKAWTWGWGSYGTMHQMDLTDADGPYNEVQTGPLLTQGEVGRLDPCEAVEWQEWWYPIHDLGGFTSANRDLAVNAERQGATLTLRAMASGTWNNATVTVWLPGDGQPQRPELACDLTPKAAATLKIDLPEPLAASKWFYVEFRHGDKALALFPLPLDLPKREPPAKKPAPQSATELAQAGWQDFLFARFPEADAHFRKALEADPKSVPARTGLAFLRLDSDPKAAALEAGLALETAPDAGLAHFARAVAADRAGDRVTALEEAWKAALDPATAVPARALVARLELRSAGFQQAAAALSEPGPWRTDPLCRNRLAYACLELGDRKRAIALALDNLTVDPLDAFARSILWRAKAESPGLALASLVKGDLPALLELLSAYAQIVGDDWPPVRRLLDELYLGANRARARDPIPVYWALRGVNRTIGSTESAALERALGQGHEPEVWPYQAETELALRDAIERNPKDGQATLLLGHLLFHLGRHAEGRELWKKAADLGAEPVVAYRALGMAAKTLDNDLKAARDWLTRASAADPKDAIVARDLANVLFALADKTDADGEKRQFATEARDRLKAAFTQGKGRSDFVALLARAHTRLGDPAETARLLDSVRITIWEGAREAHDLFEAAHLALGEAHLKAGRAGEALAEFERALEYPANLATGRLENTSEAHIHLLRGNALAALNRTADARAAWQKAAQESGSGNARQDEARRAAKARLDQP
jgi:tetratricopeptide (TPR) repeat protein